MEVAADCVVGSKRKTKQGDENEKLFDDRMRRDGDGWLRAQSWWCRE
jgi:hypothetical protein